MASSPLGRRQHVEAGHLQRAPEGPEKDLVVLDDQDAMLHAVPHGATGAATAARGMTRRTVVPRPGALSISISPPCRSMIFLTMAMPRPVPVGFVV